MWELWDGTKKKSQLCLFMNISWFFQLYKLDKASG